MKKCWLTALFALATGGVFAQQGSLPVQNGVEMHVGDGLLRVEFVKNDVVRVRYALADEVTDVDNGICVKRAPEKVKVKRIDTSREVILKSDSLTLKIDAQTGSIAYYETGGDLLLKEQTDTPHKGERIYVENVTFDESTRRTVKTADGDKEVMDVLKRDTVGSSWKWRLGLTFQAKEALYGLGGYMEDYMNLRGKKVYMCQHNLKEMVPMLNSTAGYGLLMNAGSEMMFDEIVIPPYPEPRELERRYQNDTFRSRQNVSQEEKPSGLACITVGAAPQLDYYFMKGRTMDATVKNYRWLTGEVPMMPLYLFGYTQSKERYVSSNDLISTLKRFRDMHIPIDMIVQDWSYWEPGSWGHMKMNTRDYPDKKALTDAIHAMNAKLMISIWPSMTNSPQEKDFAARGMLIPGTNVYDVFSKDARDLYWQYANGEFFSNGFDAWWCDSSEPIDADWGNRGPAYGWDSHAERFELCSKKLADALGHERSQLYSLYHAMGIYEHQRKATDEKRVVNLTRSSYAGEQRYGTIIWNGDTHASWSAFRQMLPAGLNFMATGCPYWTVDVGAFFTKKGWAWFYDGDYEKGVEDLGYRELYVRMLQYATFLPVMRSHGTDTPREPWRFGDESSPFYQSILDCIRLRYSLLPYTYSLAADITFNGGTMTRPLAFDYANDPAVLDMKDEFMMGKNLLVAPVTTPMYYEKNSQPLEGTQKSRTVYLPKGKRWYDFYTNKTFDGGQTITADAPLNRIPVFVPSGSIIPLCASAVEYAAQSVGADWEIRVYPGANGAFTVYQDAGDGYAYEKGERSEYQLLWNDQKQTLTLTARKGAYTPKAPQNLKVVLPDGRSKTLTYEGKKQTVRF